MCTAAMSAYNDHASNLSFYTGALQKALKEVDPLTAKMRRKLFKKMAMDGAILRTVGEKKPTHGLGAAELDIEKYQGENPSRYRILQQALFRKEWKVLTPKVKSMMLAGGVASNNAAGKGEACKYCMKVRCYVHVCVGSYWGDCAKRFVLCGGKCARKHVPTVLQQHQT